MKVAFFYYDGFAEFEIALACFELCRHNPIHCGLERREYRSMEKQRFIVDHALEELNPADIDLFIIPGGNPAALYENAQVADFVGRVLAADNKVAGICGGSELLASFGLLKGRRCTGDTNGIETDSEVYKYYRDAILVDDQVVVDGNIITAQGQAFAEFAVELGRQTGLIPGAPEASAELSWLKNQR